MESFIVQAVDQLSSLDFEVDNAGRRRPRGSNLTFGECRALEELAADNTIVINKADKANVIVVRNHTDYAAEGFVHLSDAAVYRELPYDTTLEVEHLVTGFVQKLFKQGLINEEMAKFCLPNKNLRTARIYFLKKTHKTPMGIRPIVSGINCPTENLSQFVDVWLQPLMRELPSYVRDSTHFINVLETMTFPKDCLLISIDVTSLYTNIPHGEGINCSVSALQKSYDLDPDQPPPQVIGEMINVVLSNNVIEFEGRHYLQLMGCAMGTRCAPSYASIIMGHVEETLQTMAGEGLVLFWRRYIDDIFLVYGGEREQFDSYRADINKIHPTIKFTAECNSDQATFLDITAYKGERFKETGVLDVKTYIKPTNKQLYVHATSYHPKGTGKGIVIGEALRYLRTNSDEANFRQCIANHKKVLKSRGCKPTTTNKLLEPITFGMRETALAPNPKRFKQKGDDAAKKTMTYTPNSLSGGSVTKINGGASASSVGECEGGEPPLTFVTTFNDVTPQVRKVVKDLWPMLHGDAVLGNLPRFMSRVNNSILLHLMEESGGQHT